MPPISGESRAEVADHIVVELVGYPEEHATLVLFLELHALMRSFEVQRDSHKSAARVLMLKGACNI